MKDRRRAAQRAAQKRAARRKRKPSGDARHLPGLPPIEQLHQPLDQMDTATRRRSLVASTMRDRLHRLTRRTPR